MIKKVTKSAQIREYVAANPKAKSADVAKAIGVTPAYVATVLWTAKKKAKVAKKVGGMQKKKAMTNKANWKTIAFASSDIPFYKDSVIDTTPKRMAQLAYEAGVAKAKLRMQGQRQIEMFEPKPDAVNHPAHYKVGGIETIDFIEAKKLGYNLGNVVKYLTRADHKGNRKQDLEKAKWYLERELSATS
jgi:prolyl-tRNA editing enzyme YbaK/EbsC (Cys-tRNA(Pro) deacylase)